MQYTVFLTRYSDLLWRASVPSIPNCEVEADTREKVISQIKEKVTSFASQTEVIQVEIPIKPQFQNAQLEKFFGIFKDDPNWAEMFEQIEKDRDNFGV